MSDEEPDLLSAFCIKRNERQFYGRILATFDAVSVLVRVQGGRQTAGALLVINYSSSRVEVLSLHVGSAAQKIVVLET